MEAMGRQACGCLWAKLMVKFVAMTGGASMELPCCSLYHTQPLQMEQGRVFLPSIYTRVCTCMCTCMCICVCMCCSVCKYACVFMCACMCEYLYACVCVSVCECVVSVCECVVSVCECECVSV